MLELFECVSGELSEESFFQLPAVKGISACRVPLKSGVTQFRLLVNHLNCFAIHIQLLSGQTLAVKEESACADLHKSRQVFEKEEATIALNPRVWTVLFKYCTLIVSAMYNTCCIL